MKLDGADVRERMQEVLDAGDRKKWHLVGVSPPGDGLTLFWDTTRPSYGGGQYGG